MKTATLRKLQHGLSAVLERVARGDKIVVTRRGRLVARLAAAKSRWPEWPDAMARLRERFPRRPVKGKATSALMTEMRGREL